MKPSLNDEKDRIQNYWPGEWSVLRGTTKFVSVCPPCKVKSPTRKASAFDPTSSFQRHLACYLVTLPFHCSLPPQPSLFLLHTFFFCRSSCLWIARVSDMSGLAPAPRLKTKTSGLSEFFGGSSQPSNPPRQTPKKRPATPIRTIPPPPSEQAESSGAPKSKKSSIPFWGKRKSSSPSPLKRKPTSNGSASPPPPVPQLSASSGIPSITG
jgi:hypothetical protein